MAKIAVLGFGVVGSGTVELFYKNIELLRQNTGCEELDIKYILEIRDIENSQFADKFTKNIGDILNDGEITVVAELMGGVNPAYGFVKSFLEKGVSVVTSNKELVAEKGAELLKTASENRCNFFFEASTGGAIPLIRPLHQCLAANRISAVEGILNGTTNFILTKMIDERMDFDSALNLAKKLGYAERDPSDDIDGYDARRKICIISSLVFKRHVYPDWVYCEGIREITREDAAYAENYGGRIKLVASAKQMPDGKILPMTRPAIVCGANQISKVDDVFNAVLIYGDAADEVMLYGKGAGKLPTASAVLADVADAVRNEGKTSVSQRWEDSADNSFIADYKDDILSVYVRLTDVSEIKIKEIFPGAEFLDREDKPGNETAFVTPLMRERDFDAALSALGGTVLAKIRILTSDNRLC